MTLLALAACSPPPAPWPPQRVAPGADAPWGGPSDDACNKYQKGERVEIDGFLLCGQPGGKYKVAIDEPYYVACAEVERSTRDVFVAFDGVAARAWDLEALTPRELVNDDWLGEPVLVDF